MAGSLDPYMEKAILDFILSATALPTLPASLYVAAFTVAPTEGAAGTEVTGGGYARLAVTRNTTNFPAATGSGPATKTNGVKFSFASAAGAAWGTITGLAIYDASTGGNRLLWGTVNTSKQIDDGDTLEIPVGGCTLTLT